MIYPTAVDCLKSIEFTLEDKIRPVLAGSPELSTLATIGHLLRHVACRIEHEGDVLMRDIAALRDLLGALRAYAGDNDPTVTRPIEDALEREYRVAGSYPGLASLAEEAGALRLALEIAHKWLIAIAGERKDHKTYRHMRQRIRAYIAEQLLGEARLIEPAFLGHGARR